MPVDLQPTLRGALVELRPLLDSDWTALYSVASDSLVWAQHPATDRYQEPVFREFFREALESGSAFAVRDVHDGKVIGSSRYHGYDASKREIEIGWTFLARSHWGGRHNGEMKSLMLQHAWKFVDRVIFVIGPLNIRSQRAVERVGGVFLERRVVDGGEKVVYAITKPDSETGDGDGILNT